MRVVERTVEGLHAFTNQIYKRAPASKIAYMSLELRWHLLMEDHFRDPCALRLLQLYQHYQYYCHCHHCCLATSKQ